MFIKYNTFKIEVSNSNKREREKRSLLVLANLGDNLLRAIFKLCILMKSKRKQKLLVSVPTISLLSVRIGNPFSYVLLPLNNIYCITIVLCQFLLGVLDFSVLGEKTTQKRLYRVSKPLMPVAFSSFHIIVKQKKVALTD